MGGLSQRENGESERGVVVVIAGEVTTAAATEVIPNHNASSPRVPGAGIYL